MTAKAPHNGLLFEWLFERRHPGPVGTVGIDHPEPSRLRPIGLLFVAYFVNPKPDPSNVGWAGGLIDHPFRWSDDQNRMLLALNVVLLPGRLAVAGVRDVVRLAEQRLEIRRGRQKKVVWVRRK